LIKTLIPMVMAGVNHLRTQSGTAAVMIMVYSGRLCPGIYSTPFILFNLACDSDKLLTPITLRCSSVLRDRSNGSIVQGLSPLSLQNCVIHI